MLQWAIPEKNQTGGVEDINFVKTPGNFFFYHLPLEILHVLSLTPGISAQFYQAPQKFLEKNKKPLKIPHWLILIPLEILLEF